MPNPEEYAQIWNRIAGWWDAFLGEGNDFQLQLVMPTTDRLLDVRPGQSVLDVACGNGNYARRLAAQGAHVLGIDVASAFVESARQRGTLGPGTVEYRVTDATDEAALLGLGEGRFDAAVCSMAMMDLPTIDPLLRALRRLLKPGGRFVFSVSHPCFNSAGVRMTAELVNENGKLEQVFGVQVNRYVEPCADLAAGILNQPEPHYTFHRPIGHLLKSAFDTGFVVDAFEEPAYPRDAGAKNAFSWKKRPMIPPAIVVRLRPA